MKKFVITLLLSLGACAPMVGQTPPTRLESLPTTGGAQLASLAPMRAAPNRPLRSNRAMARDFLDLSFQLESGRALPRFTRFDGPISLRLSGAPNPMMQADLSALLARLRSEAGLDIFLTGAPDARITIEAMPRAHLRRIVPNAACFVVPRVSGLAEYQAARGTAAVDWARLEARDKATIFVPSDAPPQAIRDCLHEELAQALGPLNDLYRLPDSVFNDDNIHSALTGFDMLMLRVTYAPELRNGMSRSDVAARLPALLARLNPGGEGRGGGAAPSSPRAWINAIQTATSARGGGSLASAEHALRIAQQSGLSDHRLGFAHYVRGRALAERNPAAAIAAFHEADRYFAATPGADLHRAFVAVYLAAQALSAGDAGTVLRRTEAALPVARAHQNAQMVATLKLLRAGAFEISGRAPEAASERLDSQAWARYGFGSERSIAANAAQIAALIPRR